MAPRIAASVCSSSPSPNGEVVLPTPTVSEANGADNNTGTGEKNLRTLIRDEIAAGEVEVLPTPTGQNGNGNATNNRGEPLLPGVVEGLLPTPVVSDAESARRSTTSASGMHSGESLTDAVDTLLPTPTRWEQRGDANTDDRNLLPLEAIRIAEAGLLPTPVTEPHTGNGHARDLAGEVGDLLPTPTTQESHSGPSQAGRNTRPLNDQVLDFLPTPIVSDYRGAPSDTIERGAMRQLRDVEIPGALLPTPDVSSSARSEESHAAGEHQVSLHDLPHLLPTPVAMEGIKGTSRDPDARREQGHQVWLSNVVPTLIEDGDPLLPTPTARDHKDTGGMTPHPEKRKLAHTIAGEDIELLPTPSGAVVNDGESAESWQERHERHAAKGDDATRSGMPLTVAVQRVNWGKYGPAIARTEIVAGREAPAPTNPDGKGGKHRLASRFVEWMMLLEEGRVTGHGLSRARELARLGNGVVPLQAASAVAVLIGRLADDRRRESP